MGMQYKLVTVLLSVLRAPHATEPSQLLPTNSDLEQIGGKFEQTGVPAIVRNASKFVEQTGAKILN